MIIASPLINMCFEKFGISFIKKLLTSFSFVPIVANFSEVGTIAGTFFFIYIYLLVLYLKKSGFNITKFKALFTALVLIAVILVSYSVSHYIGDLKNGTLFKLLLDSTTGNINRHSVIMLLLAFSIFFFAADFKPNYSKTVNYIASFTLGIYLFSENPLFNITDKFTAFAINSKHIFSSHIVILVYILTAVLIFMCGLVFEMFRYYTFQMPVIKALNKSKR